ncbi:MAG TPA: M1 family aminopeptidase [Candidatus Limnocylindria bacterium]|jgi:aminopeptidase N|nr:M1 family aminopeptidase [Candidatus Limnocylindria bacterium]
MPRPALRIILLASSLLAALAAPLRAEAPFAFATTAGRLPKDVVPSAYAIAIVPDAARRTFAGTERVTLDVRRPTDRIVFDALHLAVRDARLDGAPVARVRTDDAQGLTTLTLSRAVRPGRHELRVAYTGTIDDAPEGLFAQDYVTPDGRKGLMLSTQFESTDARRMFPAWDEPAFRATFQLRVTLPATWTAVSNMPAASRTVRGALATTTFARTPRMASYLLVLSAGDLGRITARRIDGVEPGVVAVRPYQREGAQALANERAILAAYDRYFGVRFPLPKLDAIAVPGGFGGAMENWGGITFNDQLLLLPPSATLAQRQRIYATQAHEMAHQWFGDLVTMAWWDDIWLNESFASWMAAKQTDRANPGWRWWEGQDESKERAMSADAWTGAHALQRRITSERQADTAFDSDITYNKGQAFLRMLEQYLGEDAFRAGIRRYVAAHAYSNATTADLWNALREASGKDVTAIAAGWTERPGFPLVSISARCAADGARTIVLTQRRFLLAGTESGPPERWSIPMRIASGSGAPRSVLFTTEGQRVAAGRCGEPLRANAGDVGYYRVAYDAQTLATNQRHFAALPDADKIALLDDQWALARSGRAPLPTYLALAASMGRDLDARAWNQILGALWSIERDERGRPGHDAFVRYARALAEPVATALGWEPKPGELPARAELRQTALADLGAWGDPAVIAEAHRRFAAFVADRASLDPDAQSTVLGIVALDADQATFDALHRIARGARDEGELRRDYAALVGVRDPRLAREALAIVASSEIPPQAAQFRVRLVDDAAEWNPALSWRFFTVHHDALLGPLSATSQQVLLANGVPTTFATAVPPAQLDAWIREHTPAAIGPYVTRGMEQAWFRLAERDRLVPATDAYVASAEHG